MQWIAQQIATIKAIVVEDVTLWSWGLACYVLIMAGIWFVRFQRLQKVSLKSILRHAFAPANYTGRTASVTHWHFVFMPILWRPALALIPLSAFALSTPVRDFFINQFGARPTVLHSEWSIVAVQFISMFLARDFAQYVVHYCFHKVPVLWSFHRGHHSLEENTVFGAVREHPVVMAALKCGAALFASLVCGFVLFATGTSFRLAAIVSLFGYNFWRQAVDMLDHTRVPVSYGWLNRIIESPVMHQVHHSIDRRHWDKNYGDQLMLWDWIFGTIYIPEKNEPLHFGLNSEEMGLRNPHRTVLSFYFEPFVHAWRTLRRQYGATQTRQRAI